MKAIYAVALAFLALVAATPAFAQSSSQTFVTSCQIEPSSFGVNRPPLFTLNATKLCTGVASKRNIKLDCTAPLPGQPDLLVTNVGCAINADQCGLAAKGDDPNFPLVTATSLR
jgi:hypothetical protein